MHHREVLETAIKLMDGDRAEKHGGVHPSAYTATAVMWSGFLRKKGLREMLDESDVMRMMVLFKIGRSQHGDFNEDDYIDAAAYASMACEFAAHSDDGLSVRRDDNKPSN